MSIHLVLEEKLAEAASLARALLAKPEIPLTDRNAVPRIGGVYMFHEHIEGGTKEKLYVGLGGNLHQRIHTDHMSGESKGSMSSLRRSLNQTRDMPFGSSLKEWLRNNCSISFIEIEDPDMQILVESLVIATLRGSGKLLNKP